MTIPAVAAAVRAAVVTVYVYNDAGARISLGSGFIAPDGRVVTNSHVIQGGARAEVYGSEGQVLVVAPYVEALSTALDLAILPAVSNAPARLAFARAVPAIGTSIVVVGSPEGLQNTVSDGIVSAVRQLNPGRLLQITAPISHGSSGGPVLNRNSEVVGIATLQLSDGQNLNFAVPADAIQAVLASPPGKIAFPAAVRAATTDVATSSPVGASSTTVPSSTSFAAYREMGPRWTLVNSSDRVAIGVDTTHSQVDEQLHRYYLVWIRFQYATTQNAQGKAYVTAVNRIKFDCREPRMGVVSATTYDAGGNVVDSFNNPQPTWLSITPETVAEMASRGTCNTLRGR